MDFKKKKTLSFEVFPPKKDSKNIHAIYDTLDKLKMLKPDFISVTFGANGSNSRNTIMIADYIKNTLGIEPVAHLTCGPLSPSEIETICDDLEEKNIHQVLALRGDKPMDDSTDFLKYFQHASQLIEYISIHHPQLTVGGACYPEGHPECDTLYQDLLNLKIKQESGATFFISQLFFDNNYYYRLVREARKMDISIPIIPGIMPLVSQRSIQSVMKMTGCSIPYSLRTMIERFKDDKEAMREIGINYAINQIIDLLANDCDGIHLYVMNNDTIAREIIQRINNILVKEIGYEGLDL